MIIAPTGILDGGEQPSSYMGGVPLLFSYRAVNCYGIPLSQLDSSVPILLASPLNDDCMVGYGNPPTIISSIFQGFLNFSITFRLPSRTSSSSLCTITMSSLSTMTVPAPRTLTSIRCGLGYHQSADPLERFCYACPPLTYSLSVNVTQCFSCPSGATCANSTSVIANSDRWIGAASIDGNDRMAYRCLPGYCLGNNECRAHSRPIDINPLCAECAPSYTSLSGKCACQFHMQNTTTACPTQRSIWLCPLKSQIVVLVVIECL
jgi:hypothetical protein